jgi:hypothetical protein
MALGYLPYDNLALLIKLSKTISAAHETETVPIEMRTCQQTLEASEQQGFMTEGSPLIAE